MKTTELMARGIAAGFAALPGCVLWTPFAAEPIRLAMMLATWPVSALMLMRRLRIRF